MTEQVPEPTGDEIPDGTQLPQYGADSRVADEVAEAEQGDAGVNDTGSEPWYQPDHVLEEG